MIKPHFHACKSYVAAPSMDHMLIHRCGGVLGCILPDHQSMVEMALKRLKGAFKAGGAHLVRKTKSLPAVVLSMPKTGS